MADSTALITARAPAEGDVDFDDLPGYKDKGRILFQYFVGNKDFIDRVEILDYDSDKSPFWLNENGFMDHTVDDMVDLELDGFYVLEGVHGQYYRGSWSWGEDDTEDWYFDYCRRASEQEIETGLLDEQV